MAEKAPARSDYAPGGAGGVGKSPGKSGNLQDLEEFEAAKNARRCNQDGKWQQRSAAILPATGCLDETYA